MLTRTFSLSGGFILGLLAALAAPAHGGSASLLLDITPGGEDEELSAVTGPALSLGRLALLSATDPEFGSDLWVTDGTDAGTRPLLDIPLEPLGVAGSVGIFEEPVSATTSGRWIWRSDGTRPGTFPLAPEPGGRLLRCGSTTAALGSVLFLGAQTIASDPCELWKTNGTSEGTVQLPGIGVGGFTTAGSLVYFVSFDGGGSLWRTDGTPEGTIQLGSRSLYDMPQNLVAVGARLFFTLRENGLERLWTSDGSVTGTRPLFFATEESVVLGTTLQSVPGEGGGTACFLVQNIGTGRELWCSDGTISGTRQVTSMALANPFVNLETWRVERLGGLLLFPANDGTSGNRWWTSDGRPGSTAPLSGCPGGCPVLDVESTPVRVGRQIFFKAPGESSIDPPATDLWVTDGTGAGTRRVGDFCDECRVERMFSLRGQLVFSVSHYSNDVDLWVSDGTRGGTRLLIPAASRTDEVLRFPPVIVNGRSLLTTSQDSTGPWLWVSDGTPEATERLTLLGRNGLDSSLRDLIPAPGGIRFAAGERLWSSSGTTATTGPVETASLSYDLTALGPLTLYLDEDRNLWRTDGTAAGTYKLASEGFPGELTVVGNRVVFLRREPDVSQVSLWATDGTEAGTREIMILSDGFGDIEILPGGASALVVWSRSFSDPILWRTDGTVAGTREIPLPEDFRPFISGDVAQLGANLFFSGFSDNGERIWRTGGTPPETRVVTMEIWSLGSFAAHAGSLYIFGSKEEPDSKPFGIWRSDGTEAGTILLASVSRLGFGSSNDAEFTSVGNLLFFVLEDERGRELWRTDGTSIGTFLVQDIVPGEGSSYPAGLVALDGRLYFTASSAGHGNELWESDGTEAGTRLVHDIKPGAASSGPSDLVASGGRLFFVADDGVHGREPWVYEPGGAACVPSETALCLRGGRFKVEADWRTEDGSGRGRAVSLTPDTGYFWFFDAANVEVILKVLDGQSLNGHQWVFYGALSNVEYVLTVTDTQTGAARRYTNRPGRLGSVADTEAFGPRGASEAGPVTDGPAAEIGNAIIATRTVQASEPCTPSTTRLCLQDGRFAVEARWKAQGQNGTGKAVSLAGGDTGYFWFFDASNVEVVLKVLDGTPLNGKFWVFYGALSDVEYTLTVTDTVTGVVKTYSNPGGRLASVADTGAF